MWAARTRLSLVDGAEGRQGVRSSRLADSRVPTQVIEVALDAQEPAWGGPLACEAANPFGRWPFIAPGAVTVETKTMTPGPHEVLVATLRKDMRGRHETGAIQMTIAPCQRVYLAARHESTLLVKPWQVVMKKVEPIAECLRRYPHVEPQPTSGG